MNEFGRSAARSTPADTTEPDWPHARRSRSAFAAGPDQDPARAPRRASNEQPPIYPASISTKVLCSWCHGSGYSHAARLLGDLAADIVRSTPHAVWTCCERNALVVEQHPHLTFRSAVLDTAVHGQFASPALGWRAPCYADLSVRLLIWKWPGPPRCESPRWDCKTPAL